MRRVRTVFVFVAYFWAFVVFRCPRLHLHPQQSRQDVEKNLAVTIIEFKKIQKLCGLYWMFIQRDAEMEKVTYKMARFGHSLTFRTLSVIAWVFGVLKETLRTITQFITTMVVTDMTNIRYLQFRSVFRTRFESAKETKRDRNLTFQ